jgi:hypothetical protein
MRIIIQTKGKAQKDGFALRNYQLILFQFFEFTQTLKRSRYFGHWPCYDFLYFLFAPHHSFGAGWSEVSSGRRSYCDLRHFIKFKILALYLEGQIKQKRL